MGLPTGYRRPDGSGGTVDIGMDMIEKSYLIDRYPELAGTFKQAGLWLWGINNMGNLGDNTTTNKSSPVQTIAAGTNWKQVSAGFSHVGAIKTDGTLWMWGANYNIGQLGTNDTINRSSPVQTISGGTNWKQVSAGYFATAAVKTDGTLWTWGYNMNGQLGDNTTLLLRSSPIQTISGGTNWKQVSTGDAFMGAIKTDGTLWLWGSNGQAVQNTTTIYGQLGTNNSLHRSSPVQTISGGTNWKYISCGQTHVGAIKTDGTLWTWGQNSYGGLGDNTAVDKSSPVQTISGGTNWKQVACGDRITSAIKTDGTLWSWGINYYSGMGDNTTINRSSPVQTISGGTNWKQVGSGGTVCSIKTDGTLWLWGYNGNGQLGDNTTINKSSPVQTISGGTNWKQVVEKTQPISSSVIMAIRDDSSDQI